ncbi:hypothetical protein FJQ54_04355 [Sandaracinobacter neustonicus]|uniref:Uncharacterized protein n=1 Tax=Sandaracinobacter neustonicus TaxID=1715348 RepID=A0A501XS91_9SPHN|nr:hypothetical protein [Sandaracinobacter neustonicus]TPE63084.1 hypothetical protein FJQ54_04355 [Sandaracinobacter neustonicus]
MPVRFFPVFRLSLSIFPKPACGNELPGLEAVDVGNQQNLVPHLPADRQRFEAGRRAADDEE